MSTTEKNEYLRHKLQLAQKDHTCVVTDIIEDEIITVPDIVANSIADVVRTKHDAPEKAGFRGLALEFSMSNGAIDNVKFDLITFIRVKVLLSLRKIADVHQVNRLMVDHKARMTARKSMDEPNCVKITLNFYIKH